jgi:hypothetical protein
VVIGELDVVSVAESSGFRLSQRERDAGEQAWTWLPDGDGPQPRFPTRSKAITYMSEKLEHLMA